MVKTFTVKELDVLARQFDCPVCNAKAGHVCNAPSADGRGRVDVGWSHTKRQDLVPREEKK
jgi:transcription elongation factor Elf1